MSSLSSGGGGGGAIYEDGDPVSEQLGGNESVTVPTGETWVVTISTGRTGDGDPLEINGKSAGYMGNKTEAYSTDAVLDGGDTVTAPGVGGAAVQGWSV